jgi:hypothetical protein
MVDALAGKARDLLATGVVRGVADTAVQALRERLAARCQNRIDRFVARLGGQLCVISGDLQDVLVLEALDEGRHSFGGAYLVAHEDQLIG